jgi:hypothetical protein
MGEGHYSSDAKKTKHCKGIKKLGTGKKKGWRSSCCTILTFLLQTRKEMAYVLKSKISVGKLEGTGNK